MNDEVVYGEPCGADNCPSKKFRLRADGYTYCENDHRSNRAIASQLEGDSGHFSQAARKTARKAPEHQIVSSVLEGTEAFEQYIKCISIVLLRQTQWLINEKGYPAALSDFMLNQVWIPRLSVPGLWPTRAEETQTFSSQSGRSGGSESGTPQNKVPRLVETVAYLYLGLMLLHQPVTTSDLFQWIHEDDFVFFNALSDLPTSETEILPRKYTQALAIQDDLASGFLQRETMRLATLIQSQANATRFPVLNHRGLLMRFISELSLPVTWLLYVRQVIQLLKCDFSLASSTPHYTYLAEHPEVKLMSLLVIAVKMLSPFDRIDRIPRTTSDPGLRRINWDKWNALRKGGTKNKRQWQNVTEDDIMSMGLDDIQDYIKSANFRSEIGTETGAGGMLGEVLALFPTEPRGRQKQSSKSATMSEEERLCEALSHLEYVEPDDAGEGGEAGGKARPGSFYARYHHAEEIPESGRPFLEAASEVLKMEVKDLLFAVLHFEQKLWHAFENV